MRFATIHFIGILLLTLSVCSADEFLTKKQGQRVLNELNMICGDTWCEGTNNYFFNYIICERWSENDKDATCYVGFAINSTEPKPKASDEACEVLANDYHDLIDKNTGELRWEFYENMTDCIAELEGR